MSRALLIKRLKELETAGIITRQVKKSGQGLHLSTHPLLVRLCAPSLKEWVNGLNNGEVIA